MPDLNVSSRAASADDAQAAGAVSFASNSSPDGAQTIITISDASAPRTFAFDIDLPDGGRLDLFDDGSVSLNVTRFPGGGFDAPWAIDANGQSIPTWFTVDGNQLVQHVDFDERTAFPIQADPRFSWGIVSGNAYLNRSETRIAAAAVGGGGLATLPWLALVPPPFSAVIATNVVNVGAWAVAAQAQGKCLQLKFGATGAISFPFPSIGVTPLHHTGPDCY